MESHDKKDPARQDPVRESRELRRRAEDLLSRAQEAPRGDADRGKGAPDNETLLHELSVHQIELEMQNEELRRASLDAEQAQQKYYDLYDRAPVGYVTLDRHGTLVEMNLTAALLLGQPRGSLVGRRLPLFLAPADVSTFTGFLDTVFSDGAKHACEVALAKDGVSTAAVRIEGFLAGRDPGAPPECRAALLDITERKRAEAALRASQEATRKANEELERKVRVRTAELTRLVDTLQDEVRERLKAEAELTAAHEQLGARADQLRALAGEITRTEQRERLRISTLLHDQLQQLLAAAKIQVAMVGRDADATVREAVAEIVDLLGECLATSRSLTVELSPPILHLGGLPACLEWLARWMADKHGLRVDLTTEGEIPPLAEDMKLLAFEAVRELLFNAAKHAQVDSATVHLERAEGNALRLVVSDAGRGFDPGQLTPAGKEGGGFGLFSIRERVGLVEGALAIESAPGRGSRFTLTIPLGRAATGAPPATSPEPAPNAPAGEPAAAIRLLLADDHAVVREGLARLLGLEPDLEVVGQAADGQEAVELADRLRPDVILMDTRMPGLDGIGATRAIHAAHPGIRIIGLSVFDETEHMQPMREAGVMACLSKTGQPGDLLAAIRACGRRESESSA